MEIALEAAIPTYAGGLGVLAGDTIRSAADLGLSVVAVSLVHRHGYFHQQLDAGGSQSERDASWKVEAALEPLAARVEVAIEGRAVALRAWRFRVRGVCGDEVPVYLLDADLPENAPGDRALTNHLYGGDSRYRLCQETLLGIGGVRMLRALGHHRIDRFHLNEGHAALAVLELLAEESGRGHADDGELALAAVRKRCVFTTHTPVPAGHDRFPNELVASVVGDAAQRTLETLGQTSELNLTDLALRSVRFVNGVAMRHGEVSARMFPALSDPLDHERHPPGDLGGAGLPGAVRPALPRMAPRRAVAALRRQDSARRDLVGALAREAGAARAAQARRRHGLPRGGLHDRLRAALDGLQALDAAVPRSRPPARARGDARPAPARLRRQGAPAR